MSVLPTSSVYIATIKDSTECNLGRGRLWNTRSKYRSILRPYEKCKRRIHWG